MVVRNMIFAASAFRILASLTSSDEMEIGRLDVIVYACANRPSSTVTNRRFILQL
jgi:hypothetical protein